MKSATWVQIQDKTVFFYCYLEYLYNRPHLYWPYSQHFSRYVLRTSSGVSHRIRKPIRTHGAEDKVFGWKAFLRKIIWRLQVQSQQQVRITGNTRSWLTELEQSTPVDQIKGSVRDTGVDSRVRHKTPEKGRRTYRLKRCDYLNKDDVNRPNILIIITFLLRNLDK